MVCGFNTLIFVPHFCRFLNFLKEEKGNVNDDDDINKDDQINNDDDQIKDDDDQINDDDEINDDDDGVGHNFTTVCIAWVAAWLGFG